MNGLTNPVGATVVVQARMGSKRLPGKSLARLGSHPIIDWVVIRCRMAALVSDVVVATSSNAEDDPLAERAATLGATVVRGSEVDVLSRYVTVAQSSTSEYLVRITGDCPFVQPALIDRAIETAQGIDYVATGEDGRFPRGFDVEAVRRQALLVAGREATDSVEREHVTMFIVRRPQRFQIAPLACPPWARHPELRLTLDEADDLELLRRIVDETGSTPSTLSGEDVIALLIERPDLVAINSDVRHNIVR